MDEEKIMPETLILPSIELNDLQLIDMLLSNIDMLLISVVVITFVLSPKLRESIFVFFRLFLYRESKGDYSSSNKELLKIERKIRSLEKELEKNVLKDKTHLIQNELEKFIDGNLVEIIKTKLDNPETIKESVLSSLKDDVKTEVKNYLANSSVSELQKTILKEDESKRRAESHSSLLYTLERETRSASMLKMVMINIFVAATAGFLIFNILMRPEFSSNAYIAIVTLYFSLGAFMLYIIRTSHFRSSVLLAIKEDERNYYNFEDYIVRHKSNKDLNEHDVDVIRLIMTNRSEREQKADHPYEVILKGVSGSNIQFKGGKIAFGGGSNQIKPDK